MKWNKFLELESRNRSIMDDIARCSRGRTRDQLKSIIRERVEYIAYRPVEQLAMSAQTKSEPSFIGESYRSYKDTVFTLRYHVEGELPYSRSSIVSLTIEKCMEDIVGRFQKDPAHAGKVLIWDKVVKTVAEGDTRRGDIRLIFEIYLFPATYSSVKHPMRPVVAPISSREAYARDARRAYLTGCEMPPIMPGQILDAKA